MTLPILRELSEYWHEFPPTHVLLKAFVGHESKKPASAEETIAEFQKFGFAINKHKRKKDG
jgi:hypothetical protein